MNTPGGRRFWQDATVARVAEGFVIRLDARPLVTPARAPLAVPTRALAEAIAAEWRGVTGAIRPEAMPMTRTANTSIDRTAPDPAPLVAALAAYGDTDLVCYRADAPEGLRRRQAEAWDPLLDWAEAALGATLVPVTGVMHRPQPPASLALLRARLERCDAFALTALAELVTLSGSLVIGLAVADGALGGERAWQLSRLDEAWQEAQWGEDAEAAAAAAARRRAFLAAERFLRLLDPAAA